MMEGLGKSVLESFESKAEEFKEKLKELDKPLNDKEGMPEIKGSSAEAVKVETDDTGKIYKGNGELLPATEYISNGYLYRTDELGRIVFSGGQLKLSEDERKTINEPMEKVGKGDAKDSDDRGHLIADRFGGSSKIENLIPMDANLNRGEYKALENQWAKALEEGKEVKVEIRPEYSGDSHRPDSFNVIYSIDGEVSVKVFENKEA